MSLILYRRHKKTCPNFPLSRYAKGKICKCKFWADGVLDKKEVRFSLETRDEKEAKNKVHALDNGVLIWTKEHGIIPIAPKPGESAEPAAPAEKVVTLADAWKSQNSRTASQRTFRRDNPKIQTVRASDDGLWKCSRIDGASSI